MEQETRWIDEAVLLSQWFNYEIIVERYTGYLTCELIWCNKKQLIQRLLMLIFFCSCLLFFKFYMLLLLSHQEHGIQGKNSEVKTISPSVNTNWFWHKNRQQKLKKAKEFLSPSFCQKTFLFLFLFFSNFETKRNDSGERIKRTLAEKIRRRRSSKRNLFFFFFFGLRFSFQIVLHFDTISVSPQAYVREINDQLYLNFMKVGLQLRKHYHVPDVVLPKKICHV